MVITAVDQIKYGHQQYIQNKLVKNGHGIYMYKNGDKYDGHWNNDKKNGLGLFSYANGDLYEGEYVDNMMTGLGKYTFKDGSYYDGEWFKPDFNGSRGNK